MRVAVGVVWVPRVLVALLLVMVVVVVVVVVRVGRPCWRCAAATTGAGWRDGWQRQRRGASLGVAGTAHRKTVCGEGPCASNTRHDRWGRLGYGRCCLLWSHSLRPASQLKVAGLATARYARTCGEAVAAAGSGDARH